jgi:hemolysin III
MSYSVPNQHIQQITKPILRGISHAIIAPVVLVITVILVLLIKDDFLKQLTIMIYGLTMVLLFSGSALYHIPNWSERPREILRRLDHSNIFLLIAGTYTPIAVVLLQGWSRLIVLGLVWGLSLCGVGIIAGGVKVSRWLSTSLYLAIGWIAVLTTPVIFGRVGAGGLLLVAGGILYSLGAVCYALKWPVLWRRIFSYHEVFHLLVVAASGCFLVFIIDYVVLSRA